VLSSPLSTHSPSSLSFRPISSPVPLPPASRKRGRRDRPLRVVRRKQHPATSPPFMPSLPPHMADPNAAHLIDSSRARKTRANLFPQRNDTHGKDRGGVIVWFAAGFYCILAKNRVPVKGGDLCDSDVVSPRCVACLFCVCVV